MYIIFSAKLEHSGNYTCRPPSGLAASIQVFVLGKTLTCYKCPIL